MAYDVKANSARILSGRDRAPARSFYKGIGFTDEDLSRPIVGIANTWTETMPCNYNLRQLAVRVKEGVRRAGGTPMEFNTIAISDGITMGTEGMKASLVSRELIADSMELMARGHMFDALVTVVACDKTIPAGAMALLRMNVPGVLLYGGSIMPGRLGDRELTIQDVYEAVGAHVAGKITDEELKAIEDFACPGAGACGGQFTANTMALATEFLGLAAMGGPIAAVREGDPITFDLPNRRLDLDISEDELEKRQRAWTPPVPKYTHGVFARYIAQVGPAARGAVIDAGLTPALVAATVQ